MADHLRRQIRDAAMLALTALPSTGSNVFSGRISPLKASEVPGWIVNVIDRDVSEGAILDGPTTETQAVLRLDGVAKANDETINLLDQMALEAERAVFTDPGLLALLQVPPGPPVDQVTIDDAPEGTAARLGTIVLMFPIQYRTRLGDPATRV